MSQHGRKFGAQKGNDENISEKVRKMKEKQKQWMQEREVAKVPETKSVRPSSGNKQSWKKRSGSVNSTNKSTGLTWISKDDYQLSGKRTGNKNTSTRIQTDSRRLSSRESGYGSSQTIKHGETERSRASRKSETSITGFDDGEQKSTGVTNSNFSPGANDDYISGKSEVFNDHSANDLSTQSFNALADKIAERLQVKDNNRREINQPTTGDNIKSVNKPMSNHVCSGCNTLMSSPQHSPIAIIPCGHTFCQICVSDYSKCPQCQSEIFSTAPNTVMQQIIEDFKKKQEKERLKQLEEQTRKYMEEYQNLNLRCEGLADEADRVLNSMESITDDILEEKRVARKLEKENDEIKSKIKELELEFHQNEDVIKDSSSNCLSLEQHYNEEKEKLSLIEETIKTIRNSKERAKIMIQNLAPNLKIDDSF